MSKQRPTPKRRPSHLFLRVCLCISCCEPLARPLPDDNRCPRCTRKRARIDALVASGASYAEATLQWQREEETR